MREANRDEGFEHGMLHVRIQGVHFVVTHLNSHDVRKREIETRLIAEEVKKYEAEPLVLMGDMNSLSPFDKQLHIRQNLQTLLERDGPDWRHLASRYLTPRLKIAYQPVQNLLDAGLQELCLFVFRSIF